MKVEQNSLIKATAEDGAVFVGENAIEKCHEHELSKLKRELAKAKYNALPKKTVYIPFIEFENGIDEYDMVCLRSKEDFDTVKEYVKSIPYCIEDFLGEPYEYPFYGVLIHDDCYFGLYDIKDNMKIMQDALNKMKQFLKENE